MFYDVYDSPYCPIVLVGDDNGLRHLHLDTGQGKRVFRLSGCWVQNHTFFQDIKKQLREYFEGRRKVFDVRLNPEGTDFQKRVWNELCRIPYGTTRSYGQVAAALENAKAARAVGMANSKNPIPLIVPCHRVVGSGGKLVGFAHGLEIKSKLLELEGITHG